jgi:hypothetical protein
VQQLNNLTDAADQLMTIVLDDGSVLQVELIYRAGIQRWVANITHPLLSLTELNLCFFPNMLRAWRNVIPFGLMVTSSTGLDPMNLEDWVNNNNQILILNAAEVAQVETDILGPVPLANA